MTSKAPLHRYMMTIAYDGTAYSGWQAQSNALSIQTVIEEGLRVLLRHPTKIVGAGRTDAGVHAEGQVAHLTVEAPLESRRIVYSLNALLPPQIRILDLQEVSLSFHAQRSALGKIYHYHIWTDRTLSPFVRPYRTYLPNPFDKKLFQQTLQLFVGTHDFSSFANSPHEGAASKNPIRTIHRIDMVDQPGGFRVEFEGEGFLYKMIRNLIGTAFEVACGIKDYSSIPLIIAAKDRRRAGQAAAPEGLFLMKVFYPLEHLTRDCNLILARG